MAAAVKRLARYAGALENAGCCSAVIMYLVAGLAVVVVLAGIVLLLIVGAVALLFGSGDERSSQPTRLAPQGYVRGRWVPCGACWRTGKQKHMLCGGTGRLGGGMTCTCRDGWIDCNFCFGRGWRWLPP